MSLHNTDYTLVRTRSAATFRSIVTATFKGQNTKFTVHGKTIPGKIERRKELAQICMMHALQMRRSVQGSSIMIPRSGAPPVKSAQ